MTTPDLDVLMRRFTPKQRAKLARLDRAPWSWWTSDAKFFALVEQYDRESRIRYWRVLSRVTSYDGPDYRIRLLDGNGKPQPNMIRATPQMYAQAAASGLEHSIGVAA